MRGVADVFAAGDGTDFPVKQGGIGTQQADAAAEQLAARAGAELTPQPFGPVLRGYPPTGETPHYFTNSIAGGDGAGITSTRPLWWRPTKIAGHCLGTWLDAHPEPSRIPAGAGIEGGG